MRIQEAQCKFAENIIEHLWIKATVITAYIGALVGLWFAFTRVEGHWGGLWGVVIGLAVPLLLTVVFLFRHAGRSFPREDEEQAGREEGNLQFITDEQVVQTKATELLTAARRIHYYGGVGFISDFKPWREEFQRKLLDTEVRVDRFTDVKSIKEMVDLFNKGELQGGKLIRDVASDKIEDNVNGYKKWLKTHCGYLEEQEKKREDERINFFWDFVGAPIWKYGLHCIIFDKRHVVIPFVRYEEIPPKRDTGETRSAVFIYNHPDLATGLAKCLESLTYTFGLERMSSTKMAEKV